MYLYFFNYSHETALANGHINYCPSPNVQYMEHDLMSLAFFFAKRQDCVLVPECLKEVCTQFYANICPEIQFTSFNQLPNNFTLYPWGENANLWWQLNRHGAVSVPNKERFTTIRQLASRHVSGQLLHDLRMDFPELPLCGSSTFCSDMPSLVTRLTSQGQSVLKAPWSSSGRGLRFCDNNLSESITGWCKNIIQAQGGIMVEPFFHRIADFAAEFVAEDTGNVVYKGLSVFTTSQRGSYEGNLVASQSILRDKLFRDFPENVFQKVCQGLEKRLSILLQNKYVGPLGIDMMLCQEENKIKMHPCVEMNLRNTMGMLALQLDRYIQPGLSATFQIRFEPKEESLLEWWSALQKQNPTKQDEQGLLTHGVLLLSPILPQTHYAAWLQIVE